MLSLSIGLGAVTLVLWAGYLAYATNTAGWQAVVKQADMFLLLVPPWTFLSSIWVARQRMPLSRVPAFRTLQGIGILAAVYLIFSWLSRRVYLVFFFLHALFGFLVDPDPHRDPSQRRQLHQGSFPLLALNSSATSSPVGWAIKVFKTL